MSNTGNHKRMQDLTHLRFNRLGTSKCHRRRQLIADLGLCLHLWRGCALWNGLQLSHGIGHPLLKKRMSKRR